MNHICGVLEELQLSEDREGSSNDKGKNLLIGIVSLSKEMMICFLILEQPSLFSLSFHLPVDVKVCQTLWDLNLGEVMFQWCRWRGDATGLHYFTTLLHYELPVVSYKPCALLHPSILAICQMPLCFPFWLFCWHTRLWSGVFFSPWISNKELAVVDLEIGFNFPPYCLIPLKSRAGICILSFGSKCWAYKQNKRVLTVVVTLCVSNIPLFEILYATFLTWRISTIFLWSLAVFSVQVLGENSPLDCSLTFNLLISNKNMLNLLTISLDSYFCKDRNFGYLSFVYCRTKGVVHCTVNLCEIVTCTLCQFDQHYYILEGRQNLQHSHFEVKSRLGYMYYVLVYSFTYALGNFRFVCKHVKNLLLFMGSYKPP